MLAATSSLTEIANSHGTDKGTNGPSDAWSCHNFTDVYAAYIERFRFSPITMLEIGMGVVGDRWVTNIVHGRNTGGASIKTWYDYFTKATIFGIDINEANYLDNDRIRTFVADQGDLKDLDAFTEATKGVEFDLIVDDGSHRPDHQQISFGYFFKKLKSGGIYFIEDLIANGMGDGSTGRLSCDTVKNTRSVFKHFLRHGDFLQPHALLDTDYLKDNIESINFHVPSYSVKWSLAPSLRQPIRTAVTFEPESETLCAIRKK